MNGLNKLPGLQRTHHGPERAICRRLPAMLAWGTVLPLLVAALRWLMAPGRPDAGPDDAGRMLLIHPLQGLVVLHRTLLPTLAMVFGVVMLMKGPASVASPCPSPGRGLRT